MLHRKYSSNIKPKKLLEIIKRELAKMGDISPDDTMTTIDRKRQQTWESLVLSGDSIELNDGWYIIELDWFEDVMVYVDLTTFAYNQLKQTLTK